jgi:hypothetical protein
MVSGVRGKVEIKAGAVLELQRTFHAIALPSHHDEGREKAENFKVPPEFVGVPDLGVLLFEGLTASRFSVDLCNKFPTYGFDRVIHDRLLSNGMVSKNQ